MARKHHKPEEIVAKLRQVEVLVGQGKPVAEGVRAIGVTEAVWPVWLPAGHGPAAGRGLGLQPQAYGADVAA